MHGESGPAANEEFVLSHIDGVEASGFTAHFKLPHYVTFQADISVLERTREHRAAQFTQAVTRRQQAINKIESSAPFDEESDLHEN
jgi:alpha-D-ribose 1-methylphosphonate 5-triphosphate synthase subunit PhnI